MATAPEFLIELFGERNGFEAALKCLNDPWFAAVVKVADYQRQSMAYARDQLATLTETDRYGNAVRNAFVELDGALRPAPYDERLALLTSMPAPDKVAEPIAADVRVPRSKYAELDKQLEGHEQALAMDLEGLTAARVALGTASLSERLGSRYPRIFREAARRNSERDEFSRTIRKLREQRRLLDESMRRLRGGRLKDAAEGGFK